MAVELIVEPLTVVSGAARGIVQDSCSCHLVILKLPLIVSTIFE